MLIIYGGMLGICVSIALLSLQIFCAGDHGLFIWHLGDGKVLKHQISHRHLSRLAGVNVIISTEQSSSLACAELACFSID